MRLERGYRYLPTLKGWHKKAQGAALGKWNGPQASTLKGWHRICLALAGQTELRPIGTVPRAAPWAFLLCPFRARLHPVSSLQSQ